MTESLKTLIAVAAAILLTLVAVLIRPQPPGMSPDDTINTDLFVEFEDPLAAKSLEVVQYNEELAEVQEFKVAEIDGLWSIPSHNNYPADAENKIRDAATILVDLKIMGVATDQASEHAMYGVVDPNKEEVEAGEEGVGMRIVMKDENGANLAELVVGKAVKGSDGQRFVRRPNQDRVYVVKISPDTLSTKFKDWIETDLLDINTWDIKQILIKDYSVQTAVTLRGPAITNYNQRMQMQLSLENSSDWNLDQLLEDRDGELIPAELLADEELNNDRLREAKDAFDDLEIVDVERKPAGLSKELRAETDFMENTDSLKSLFERGFYPVDLQQDGQLDLLCSDGEVLVRTDDGVEYVLRFGQIAGLQDGEEEGNLNRYLFVMARLWEDKFLELSEGAASEEPGEADSEATGESPEDAAAVPTDSEEPAADSEEPAADSEEPAADSEEPAADSEEPAAESETSAGSDASEGASDSAPDSPPITTASSSDEESSEKERELDERQEKLKKAEEKIAKLNDRFSDWYYIISEDVFKKIHLGRTDVIKTKEDSQEGFDVNTLQELEKGLGDDQSESE